MHAPMSIIGPFPRGSAACQGSRLSGPTRHLRQSSLESFAAHRKVSPTDRSLRGHCLTLAQPTFRSFDKVIGARASRRVRNVEEDEGSDLGVYEGCEANPLNRPRPVEGWSLHHEVVGAP